MRRLLAILLLLAAAPLHAQTTAPANLLQSIHSFMYQFQNLENPKALDALAQSPYDLLGVEPTGTVKDQAHFDMKAMVAKLHAGKPGRLVLAYLNAGQAESYRTYWARDWKPPTRTARGTPDFILIPDPDGWSDNYPVAYWDKRWQETLVIAPNSELRTVMAAGFDGLYLDWIDAGTEPRVVAAAKDAHIDPAKSMVDFLLLIRQTARQINPRAVIVQQNAIDLLDADPRLRDAIDGLGVEDTWFSGRANAKWDSPRAGDIPNRDRAESSPAARLKQYRKFLAAGKPVFTIDYCLDPAHARQVYTDALHAGLIPLVTRVSLDHLTTTPPPLAP